MGSFKGVEEKMKFPAVWIEESEAIDAVMPWEDEQLSLYVTKIKYLLNGVVV